MDILYVSFELLIISFWNRGSLYSFYFFVCFNLYATKRHSDGEAIRPLKAPKAVAFGSGHEISMRCFLLVQCPKYGPL